MYRRFVFVSALIAVLSVPFILNSMDITVDNNKDQRLSFYTKKQQKMKAVKLTKISERDYYENISITSLPIPKIKEDEVLIKVHFASISNVDLRYENKITKNQSFVPCSDFSGTVVAFGANVEKFTIGDKVFGFANTDQNHDGIQDRNGACAEYVAVNQKNLQFKPFSLTFAQAATIPTDGLYAMKVFDIIKKRDEAIEGSPMILLDDPVSQTSVFLATAILRNDIKDIGGIGDRTIEGFATTFGINRFIPTNTLLKIHEKNNKDIEKIRQALDQYDIIVQLNDVLPFSILAKFLKNNGYIITRNHDDQILRMYNKNINIVSIKKEVDMESLASIVKMVNFGRLNLMTNNIYYLDKFRDALIRAKKGNLINQRIVIKVSHDNND